MKPVKPVPRRPEPEIDEDAYKNSPLSQPSRPSTHRPESSRPVSSKAKTPVSRISVTSKSNKKDEKSPHNHGTIKPVKSFDVDTDVDRFRKAIDLWNINEDQLMYLLATRSSAQRQLIQESYLDKYRVVSYLCTLYVQ